MQRGVVAAEGGGAHRAAGVDDEVGRVQDAAAAQLVAEAELGQLVVGAAGDDAAAQAGDGAGVERVGERARREDVDVGVADRRGRDGDRAALGDGARHRGSVDVGDRQTRARRGELLAKRAADAAEAPAPRP